MSRKYRAAFTLIELLVVIFIIGIITTIAIVASSSVRDKARQAAAQEFEANVYRGVGADIVGEWLFDEGGGAIANDTSGNGHDGTIFSPARVAGKNGGALNFPPGSYVLLGNDPALNPANFTITVWVKSGDVSGSYNYIYSNARDCCGLYNGINLMIVGNGLYASVWENTIGANTIKGSLPFPNNSDWRQVAFSYNGSKMALYMDGHVVATSTFNFGVGQPASFATVIGSLSNCPAGCNSGGLTLDQVRLYSTTIVAEDIRKIYLAEKKKYIGRRTKGT